jgi:hypothetical protein
MVTAAGLLAAAAFSEGKHAQAFPGFGSERMGAPVTSFCRIADKPISTHEPVPGAAISGRFSDQIADGNIAVARAAYAFADLRLPDHPADPHRRSAERDGEDRRSTRRTTRSRPDENTCNRTQLDSPVGINSVERFLGNEAIKHGRKAPVDAAPTGKRVLVVGAGPSSLSAAYHLTRLGKTQQCRIPRPLARPGPAPP